MTEESRNKNTPAHANETASGSTKARKSKAPKPQWTDADVCDMARDIVSVPRRRRSYSSKQALEKLAPTILAALQEGRSIDDIFLKIAPKLHVSRKTFTATLGEDNLQAAEAEGSRAIVTTATEIIRPAQTKSLPDSAPSSWQDVQSASSATDKEQAPRAGTNTTL